VLKIDRTTRFAVTLTGRQQSVERVDWILFLRTDQEKYFSHDAGSG
jgi:hypothetical protein